MVIAFALWAYFFKIRALFKGFRIKEVSTTYSMPGAQAKKKVTELLLMNF